jgi:hypothetical protein
VLHGKLNTTDIFLLLFFHEFNVYLMLVLYYCKDYYIGENMIESREEEALLVQHRQLVRELNDYRKGAGHLKK